MPPAPPGPRLDPTGPATTAAPGPAADVDGPRPAPDAPARRPDLSLLAVVAAVLAAAALRPAAQGLLGDPAVAHAATVFVAIVLQALPFLALGVSLSAAIEAFVPQRALGRTLGGPAWRAVPTAALAGVALPGCECGSVPLARRLMDRGIAPATALAFMLAAPAVNPVVLVATAVAFPQRPEMPWARLAAGLLAAVTTGWVWALGTWWSSRRRSASADPTGESQCAVPRSGAPLDAGPDASAAPPVSARQRAATFLDAARSDLVQAGGFLVLGAGIAAALQTLVPRQALADLGGRGLVSVLVLAAAAVVLCVCSEADAFVAVGFTGFSPTAQLAFMTVGPMVDAKLAVLALGTFGRSMTARLAPLAAVAATGAALLVGGQIW